MIVLVFLKCLPFVAVKREVRYVVCNASLRTNGFHFSTLLFGLSNCRRVLVECTAKGQEV